MATDPELKALEEGRMSLLVAKVQNEFFPELIKRKFRVKGEYMLPKNILTINEYDEINFDPFIFYFPEKIIIGMIGHELSHIVKGHLDIFGIMPFPIDLLCRRILEKKADKEVERRGLKEYLDQFKNLEINDYLIQAKKESLARRIKDKGRY